MPITLQPTQVGRLRCPRCWTFRQFVPYSPLGLRCTGCEWPFTLSAPTVNTPAVPSSGTATTNLVTNSTGTVVQVTVTGGTLTFVFVNGVQAGTTAGTYLVPAGGTISITYSVAPTWAWALPPISAGVSAGGLALPFSPTGTNVAFSQGQVLVVDPAGTSDIVTVSGTPTATSVPVSNLNFAHLSGVLVTVAQTAPTLSGVENVPQTAY
jgi:hypothetical protein